MELKYNDFREGVIKENKVLLIDADFIKHVTSSRASKIIEEEMIEDIPTMKKVYRVTALGMCEDLNMKFSDPKIFCFSGKSYNTFRCSVSFSKEYKGNRKRNDLSVEEQLLKLELMKEAMDSIIQEYVSLIFDDLEADDILSMLQDDDTYIYSKDKDLKQVPGFHYDESSDSVIKISPGEAYRFLATQMLTGDSSDNIPGLPGVGPKNAEKILTDISDKNAISEVYRQFKKKFGIIQGTDLFVENWMLIKLRMARGEHFITKYKSAFSLLENIKQNFLTLNPKN